MADVDLTTNVSLHGVSVSATVYEDIDNTGGADNQETVSLGNGTNTYGLTTLNGGGGNGYWISINPSTNDITKSPVFHSAELLVETSLPITYEGDEVTEITIDGEVVTGLTHGGDMVF